MIVNARKHLPALIRIRGEFQNSVDEAESALRLAKTAVERKRLRVWLREAKEDCRAMDAAVEAFRERGGE